MNISVYRNLSLWLFAELALLALSAVVDGQTVTETCAAQGVGGGVSTAGPYMLTDTIGQPSLGWSDSSNFTFAGGFWFQINALALTPASNQPPTTQTITFSRLPGASIKIKLLALATNWSDPDAHRIEFVAAGSASTNGVPIYFDGNILFYAADTSQNQNVNDAFNYVVRDIPPPDLKPLTNSGTILIKVDRLGASSFNIVRASRTGDGKVSITASGIPGQVYLLQRTLSLTDPVLWVTLANSTTGTTFFVTGPNGIFTYIDPDSSQFTQCYYRTALP